MMKKIRFRTEFDSLGEVKVPAEAYYGAQTQRALENFPISGLGAYPIFIRSYGAVKIACALVNVELGRLDKKIGRAIVGAAKAVWRGKLNHQFVVDVFQAGAGTSFNMNTNEVIANYACELLGSKKAKYKLVHPNDHVNMGQSTNDTFPTAMRLSTLLALKKLYPQVDALADSFMKKSRQFSKVVKSGRTHLQDAAPVTLGQEFGAHAESIKKGEDRIKRSSRSLEELGLGGSAVGTGMNTHPRYRGLVTKNLSNITGLNLRPAKNLFEAMQSMAPFTEVSGALKNFSTELSRIANDLRLLSSGPRTGLAEIELPAVQPGSSMMPGKVNPVMAEMANMVCFQVLGNDTTISYAAQAGQLELNVMMPVIAYNLLQSIDILTNTCRVFKQRCIDGIVANQETCRRFAESSLALVTILSPIIGYRKAAEVAKRASRENRSILDVVREMGILTEEESRRVFDIEKMTRVTGMDRPKPSPQKPKRR
jgi:aspartate ammonia-lyase